MLASEKYSVCLNFFQSLFIDFSCTENREELAVCYKVMSLLLQTICDGSDKDRFYASHILIENSSLKLYSKNEFSGA